MLEVVFEEVEVEVDVDVDVDVAAGVVEEKVDWRGWLWCCW